MSRAKQSSGLTSRIDPPIRDEAGSQGDLAMRVLVNGVRLFFDVEGAKLVPDGPAMREKPTLVLGGEDDPMHPIESQADIAAALPADLVQFERFANCGHAVVPDAPERAMAVIRDFIGRR
jgi:pimeloyl-ACP methyl ester carboxylesterase